MQRGSAASFPHTVWGRGKGGYSLSRKRISPLHPQEKGRGAFPLDPAHCRSEARRTARAAQCGCGVHGFAMNPYVSLRLATAPYYREARVTLPRRQTACRMRHCCARRIQRNDRISGRFLVLLSRQVQLGQLRRRMPRMCSPCRGSRSRSLRAYHLENAPICWSSAARLEF